MSPDSDFISVSGAQQIQLGWNSTGLGTFLSHTAEQKVAIEIQLGAEHDSSEYMPADRGSSGLTAWLSFGYIQGFEAFRISPSRCGWVSTKVNENVEPFPSGGATFIKMCAYFLKLM